ncbi:O-antigen ligase [Sphingomonas kaistensis]|uniref:O-antigen ligase n=1 Tax=Sphingomonas kaistensis TaxID=298708 RepID=A0A7X5Y9R5_9SPHN|nr:O-antigen ligase family protein [Sphingomonas kaistensis]NJC06131.1 O-antigen ligase [Sphingomonas kaistensis]
MSMTVRHLAVPLFLIACLLLGGSPQGIWRNLILQVGGLSLIAWALLSSRRSHPTSAGRLLLWLGGLWFALVLLQLIPLPPQWWSVLPGRAPAVEGFVLRGEPLPWLPLSLAPAQTLSTLPLLAVPLGVIAAVVVLGAYRSRWAVAALVSGTCVSVLLGAVQLSQGGPYLFDNYNTERATGLFANSNHQATLLLATLPFLGALIGQQQQEGRKRQSAALGRIVIALGAVAVILLGIILNGSMAGLGLLLPVGLASLAVALPNTGKVPRLLAGVALLLMLAAMVGIGVLTDAGSNATSLATRSDIYRITLAAIGDTFPAGTGLGSFQTYYRLYENPALVDSFFINHAHSDPLEWILETGLLGALLLGALLLWWGTRALRLWRAPKPDLTALAATIASGAILAHSLVDYPLRDAAIQAVFALSLAFMAEPRSHSSESRSRSRGQDRAPRHLTLDDDGPLSG